MTMAIVGIGLLLSLTGAGFMDRVSTSDGYLRALLLALIGFAIVFFGVACGVYEVAR